MSETQHCALSAFEQVELQRQRDELLFTLRIISESKTCPAVYAHLAQDAINKVEFAK